MPVSHGRVCSHVVLQSRVFAQNLKPTQVNFPWYIPAIQTKRDHFDAPVCPVGALRFYFCLMKDNNPGQELSTTTISQWICNTIVEAHAALSDSKDFPKSVKPHEVRLVVTFLQLFPKVELQSILKAHRWLSSKTFTLFYLRDLCPLFYLRDLCPQVYKLHKARPVGGGRIVTGTSSYQVSVFNLYFPLGMILDLVPTPFFLREGQCILGTSPPSEEYLIVL